MLSGPLFHISGDPLVKVLDLGDTLAIGAVLAWYSGQQSRVSDASSVCPLSLPPVHHLTYTVVGVLGSSAYLEDQCAARTAARWGRRWALKAQGQLYSYLILSGVMRRRGPVGSASCCNCSGWGWGRVLSVALTFISSSETSFEAQWAQAAPAGVGMVRALLMLYLA